MSLTILLLAACGRDLTEADVKFVGVGNHPDEIGPAPDPYGGYIEYDYVNFAGGGLSLGALGLLSFDEVGPDLISFKPPYAAIYGLSFVFEEPVPAPDAHHGNIGVPPAVDDRDACWTNLEPFSFLMASTVEMGDEVSFRSEDGATIFALGRIPEIYPPDPQDIFVYYSQVEAYLANPAEHWAPNGDEWEREIMRPSNWKHGAAMTLEFPGGIPPLEAPVSSIPLPSASVGEDQVITLPTQTQGLSVSWDGPVYTSRGQATDDEGGALSGAYTTCVRYFGQAAATADFAEDCLELPTIGTSQEEIPGQLYTGPWDSPDGVTFNWVAGDSEGETVVLNVRFLGPVDRTDDTFLDPRVPLKATSYVEDLWSDDVEDELVEGDAGSPPQGYRGALACDDDEDFEYSFDPTLADANGELGVTLQGDPTFNLAEVSCRLQDDGEFTLTLDHLERALDYAHQKGAEGAIFYFSRSTELDADVPLVKDNVGNARDIGDVKVRAHSVDIGRFWVESPDSFDVGGN